MRGLLKKFLKRFEKSKSQDKEIGIWKKIGKKVLYFCGGIVTCPGCGTVYSIWADYCDNCNTPNPERRLREEKLK
jgi:hypothetical protein